MIIYFGGARNGSNGMDCEYCIVGMVRAQRLIMCVFRILTIECTAIGGEREGESGHHKLHRCKMLQTGDIFVVFAMSGFMVLVRECAKARMPKASQECTFIFHL